jgi:glycosyltransferase involved in cell wall biosynthesis
LKILINSWGCGFGNNGGSSSIIKSANTLQELGHEVILVDSGKPKYTWSEIKVPHLIIKDLAEFPTGDVVIATGSNTFKTTSELPKKCGNKFIWLRGWELWNSKETDFVNSLKNFNGSIICNSIGLRDKLREHGMDSWIVRPGYDFDEFRPMDIRGKTEKVVIGALMNSGTKRANKRTEWVYETYINLLKKNIDVEVFMFGSEGDPTLKDIKFFRHPDIETKNKIYNICDIWLSTSELEGLHIAPAEAMLTECPVVGTNALLGGTSDYLIDDETGKVSLNTLESFSCHVKKLALDKALRKRLGKNAREKILSLGDRKYNMSIMVDVLKGKRS